MVLLLPSSARAQQITGDVQGRVLGAERRPLGDAGIVVTGPSLQGERQTVSDARGRFILQSLPPGVYSVAIRRIGYGPIRFHDVTVRLGNTTSLGDVLLQAQVVQLPELLVSGAKPAIDPVSPATGATLDSARFLTLPAGRDFRALLPLTRSMSRPGRTISTQASGRTALPRCSRRLAGDP